ncbi:T9SS type B sorting domain-containing protein [uncultured Algibacter sp.]|uniref:T9SS type B sorting domain-containing protein n=1 Tax=uncultured Algibacter sp. TaxID=298659 RepID=UPI00263707B4|nr:T9SS type B sorting domain-containing protein [uncultured Algibacter sp.]
MKKNLHASCALVLLFFGFNLMFSQQITVDNSIPLQQLIENNLADGCVEISNVNSTINGSTDGFTSYGAFQRGSSNFPLNNGIVLSTGNATSAGNTVNNTPLSEGTLGWGTDPDIETYLGVGNTVNATSIEFDFISISDMIQFNYILASEEYFGNYPCNSSDGFVFLIREATSTGPYQNIAVVPGSGDTVTVNNIHDEILSPTGTVLCSAMNDSYYDGSFNDTNYVGRTAILTAGFNVLPNVQYHVKLIVADQNANAQDPSIDTAVFIEANTFNELELGDDISTCSGSVTLNGEIQNPLATYAWFRDNSPISGENNPTLTTTISGLYRVEISINGFSCTVQDEVNVTIDTELSTDPITPYQLCDSDGNNQEFFDLTTKDTDVENAIQNLPPFYTIRYYLTDADARTNPNNNITSITSGSRTIFVRVEDTSLGCLIFGTIDLEVNPLPTIIQPSDINECDNDNLPNSSTQIDLSQRNNEVTGGNPNLSVTYHFTPLEAQSGANPVPISYTNTNPSETLYIRIVNTLTGCANASGETLTINITNGNTGIVRDTQFIDACDMDHDGFFNDFDLTSILNNVLNGQTGFLPPTYHTSQTDAETGNNPIPNPNSYANTDQDEQTIYLRLEDATTGCYAIVPIEVHTNLLLTATNIPQTGFAFCDQDNDGSVDVYLNTIENAIANGLPNVSVTFYNSESDRDSNISPIDTSNPYVITMAETVYLRLENGLCTELSEVILRINPVVTFNPVAPFDYCDTDDDGFTTVDFDTFDSTITGGNTDFGVRYYTDPNDADTGVGSLPQFHDTSSGIFYARIENSITGCYTVNQFEVNVIPAPTVLQPNDILICNNSTNTTANIRLQDKIDTNEIVADPTNVSIEFFTDLTQAETFDIANPLNNLDKQSFAASTQSIFVRVQSTASSGCYNIVSFNVIVNTIPVIPNITPFQICVDPGTSAADFYFQDKDAEILNGQTGKEVRYFRDALFTDEVDKTIAYNSTGSETIYVLVENISDVTCNSNSSFLLEIGTNPNYNTNFTAFPSACQNDAGNRVFDLEAKRQEIAQGSTDILNINFYLSLNDAEVNASNFLPPTYISQELQGQFYARIENDANQCFIIEEVTFITFPTPVITSATIQPICDIDYDGIATINLNNAIYTIENVRPGFGDVTFTFFEDAALTIQIPSNDISNYTVNNSATIYVNVENATNCSDSTPLDLQINLPPTFNVVGNVPDCENQTNSYDLSQVDNLLVNDPSLVSINYYTSQIDAANGVNAIPNKIYNYLNSGAYTIHARIEDLVNSCPAFTSFTLQINPNPIANVPPNLFNCDNDFDSTNRLEFDLTLINNTLLGTQNAADYSIYYYNSSINNAETDSGRLNDLYSALNGETIYVRIENNITGCYSTTQFQTTINPLPVIPINDIEAICSNDIPRDLNADTGNFGDTYLWWTGETTPNIEVDLTDIGTTRWVEVTTGAPQSCTYRREFEIIESIEATIEATATADFTDPNTITVTVSGIGDYQYILDPDLGGQPQDSNVFNNVSLGPHIVRIIDLNGCTPTDTDVFVIDIPKFVTPNNDSHFDTWHVVGIDRLPGTLVYIYNRHGKLIKMLPHTSIGWDGTFNGQNMPSDDYWFSADIIHNGESFNIRGHFALKR